MVVMSPRFGASGQWWAKTRATGSLISENHTVRASGIVALLGGGHGRRRPVFYRRFTEGQLV